MLARIRCPAAWVEKFDDGDVVRLMFRSTIGTQVRADIIGDKFHDRSP